MYCNKFLKSPGTGKHVITKKLEVRLFKPCLGSIPCVASSQPNIMPTPLSTQPRVTSPLGRTDLARCFLFMFYWGTTWLSFLSDCVIARCLLLTLLQNGDPLCIWIGAREYRCILSHALHTYWTFHCWSFLYCCRISNNARREIRTFLAL